MKQLTIYLFLVMLLAACDFLEPVPLSDLKTDEVFSHGDYGEGILTTAYLGLNDGSNMNTDLFKNVVLEYYTDNAIPNQPGTNALALGSWTVENNPIGDWAHCYNMIRYLNTFLEEGRELHYAVSDTYKDSVINSQRIGEAFYLRAWYQWLLLKNYSGIPEGGSEALGFPIVNKVLSMNDNLDLSRNTYEECVAQIATDCDSAIRILPLTYNNGTNTYNGLYNRGRGSGSAAMALKARVYLYAASPAFGNATQANWERAAKAAYDAIVALGGLKDLAAYGNFSDSKQFDNIWISPPYSHNDYERYYYPPSLYGNGNCNPSQNLIDAFPASDGYPIDKSSKYNPLEPYANRDGRFSKFIFFNGDSYVGTTIQTNEGGKDAPGSLSQYGTRTGYYMKKFMSQKITLVPGNEKTDYKFTVYLAKPELFLNFAEAANEAYGPTNNILGISAKDALKVVRKRGVGATDPYLDEQANAGKDGFRTLLQNERRIELCFEGHYFWDVRRWNLPLNHIVKAAKISAAGTIQYVDLENHTYEEYMRFIPVPYDQTLIMKNLKQNQGWK